MEKVREKPKKKKIRHKPERGEGDLTTSTEQNDEKIEETFEVTEHHDVIEIQGNVEQCIASQIDANVEIAQDMASVSQEELRDIEKNYMVDIVEPSAPNFRDLNALVNQLQLTDFIEKPIETLKVDVPKANVVPFTFEEIEEIFGMKEVLHARVIASEFEAQFAQVPPTTHPLYEALVEYQRARSQAIANRKDVTNLSNDSLERQKSVWVITTKTASSCAKCSDGIVLSDYHKYSDAVLLKDTLTDLQKDLSTIRDKAGDNHSLYSHSERLYKIQVDDILWNAIVSGKESMKDALKILFYVIRTSGWGYDKQLRLQLRNWCCLLASSFLKIENNMESFLFILHHIIRVPQGIRWALYLIQCEIKSINDIYKAFCFLEVILILSNKNEFKPDRSLINQQSDKNDLMIASEATDDSLWLVVDSEGEDADIETSGSQNKIILRENDILGLIRQIPFESIFRELVVVKVIADDVLFCGKNLTGTSLLKVFSTFRILMNTFRHALVSYKKYEAVTREICHLTLHCIMYCSDLWEIISTHCELCLVERLNVEYDNIFLASVSTLECAGAREISAMFMSEIPFKLCKIDHVVDLYKKLTEDLIISDSKWCYYTLTTISNMGIIRKEESLISTIIKKLFEIGFTSDFVDLGCGEWARTLCGMTLKNSMQFMDPVLNNIPPEIPGKWLNDLPLSEWKPHTEELIHHLNVWKNTKLQLIPFLLKSLNWEVDSGLCLQTQRNVANFLITLVPKPLPAKYQVPEWIWECLLLLKVHNLDWNIDLSCTIQPEDILGIDLSGKCLVTNTVLMLTTSWGHSVPLILHQSSFLLTKLANANRFVEVAHILHYLFACLAQCPESMIQNKLFKDLLILILKEERTLHKAAVRLVSNDFPGPNVKLLLKVMHTHLTKFKQFSYSSPKQLMSVWINWIALLDNWQSDWISIYLLDKVLGYCFFFQDAMAEATDIFKGFIQIPTSPKSPSSSSFGSWFWSNSNSFKGLIQCYVDAPFMWYSVFWLEHIIVERNTGLWQKLVEKLSSQKDGTKINVDKTFKSIGGSDTSSGLVIYRCIQCAINMPLSHPIYTLIWQLFFYLYLDISFLSESQIQKPVGPLFFQGILNSKTIVKAKSRLMEAKIYHQIKAKEITNENTNMEESSKRSQYHEHQAILMNSFYYWLDENFFNNISNIYDNYNPEKLRNLMRGQNIMWMETVDLSEYNNYLFSSSRISLKSNILQQSSKNKDLSPQERILNRLKTYEKPITTSLEKFNDACLSPIIDPTVNKDFDKAFKLIVHNLSELNTFSVKYVNQISSLTAIDQDLYGLIVKLYRKHKFQITTTKSCSATCSKKAVLTITGTESLLNADIKNSIEVNRKNHQTSVENILNLWNAYLDVSKVTSVIIKLSHLACSNILPLPDSGGLRLFNVILSSLKDENLLFPPVKNTLTAIGTQLGEKFIRKNGSYCINLVSRMDHLGNDALICSLLSPLDLPSNEMIKLYAAVNKLVGNFHVAFSCLSKFRISVWLRDTRPGINDRNILIEHICEFLGINGCNPPEEKIMLHELLCVHLSHLLSWEFPVHLHLVSSRFHLLSLEKKLHPDCWEHCFNVIEKYPHMISHQMACGIMEMIGLQWWTKRGTWGLHGLYDRYSLYTAAMSRLGALLTSAILNSAMVHQPLLLSHEISSLVFNPMCTFWNVWLVPKWESQQSLWQSDYTRSPPLMPWGPEDNVVPDIMLNAFVETLTYCIETLPGSTDNFLRLTWHWYVDNYPHMAVGLHVLGRVHKALAKLPWSINCDHWITLTELQSMYKISTLPLPSCHSFCLTCLGDRTWKNWIYMIPEQMQSNALHLLLLTFFKLRPDQRVLDDSLHLPWSLLKEKHFEEIINIFVNTVCSPSEPFYTSVFFPLICSIGGLKENYGNSIEWQTKRVFLIKEWINLLSSVVENNQERGSLANVNKIIISSTGDLLNAIEITIKNLATSDTQKLEESTILLNTAIMMLNLVSLQDIAKVKWIEWITTKTSSITISSLIHCILSVTNYNIFAELAEVILTTYFIRGGDWIYICSIWKNNCIVPVKSLIDNNSLLTAFAAFKSVDISTYEGKEFENLHKLILTAFLGFVPTSSNESRTILWVFYLISLSINSTLSKDNQIIAYTQITSILEKWSEEPGLWKTYVKNIAPSPKFRIVTKCVYCNIVQSDDTLKPEDPQFIAKNAIYNKFLTSIENAIEQKQNSSIKSTLIDYVANLKRNNKLNRKDAIKKVIELASNLYVDSNYILRALEVFQS